MNMKTRKFPSTRQRLILCFSHMRTSIIPAAFRFCMQKAFRGRVITTEATADLCGIMLRDSAHIQMFEAEWRNRKAKRAGQAPYIPLYDMEDAEGVLKRFSSCRYGETIRLSDSVSVRFTDVGHLLGSASIEVWLEERGGKRKIVFSVTSAT